MNQFEQAKALILSYIEEGTDDARLSEVLTAVRDTCGQDAFNRMLVLAAATKDYRYDQYGAADVLLLLRSLEITADFQSDVERLLESMRVENADAESTALREAAEETNPFRRAAVRLFTKFREPNIEQVMYELTKL